MLHVLNTLKDDKSWSFVGGLGVGNIHKLVGVESGKYLLFYFILFYFILFFWPHCMACRILIPRPGIEPASPALGVQSLNHWTAKEIPGKYLFRSKPVTESPVQPGALVWERKEPLSRVCSFGVKSYLLDPSWLA